MTLRTILILLLGFGLVALVGLRYPAWLPFGLADLFVPKQRLTTEQRAALEQPQINTNTVLSYAEKAVIKVLTLNGPTAKNEIMTARNFFTKNGYKDYLAFINSSGQKTALENPINGLIAKPTSSADLLDSRVLNGVYGWQIMLPFSLSPTTDGQTQGIPQNLLARIRVVPSFEPNHTATGLAIESWTITSGELGNKH